jgi:uncharacterized metal-binding protein
MILAHNVEIIYRKASHHQLSFDAVCTPIAQLTSDNQHLTKWFQLVGICSGTHEIPYIKFWKPFQPQSKAPPVQHESW